MEENKNKFNYFEKIFLRISLGLLGSGVALFILMFVFMASIPENASQLANIIGALLIFSGLSFFIAVFRIFKFAFVVSKRNDGSTITGSIITFITSPTAFAIYYIMFIIIVFSSCAA